MFCTTNIEKSLKSDLSDSDETGFWEVDRIGKSSSAVNVKYGRLVVVIRQTDR